MRWALLNGPGERKVTREDTFAVFRTMKRVRLIKNVRDREGANSKSE